MRIIIMTIAALAAGFLPAAAADSYASQRSVKDDPIPVISPVVPSWTGIWVAALAGYNMSNTELGFDVFGQGEGGSFRENVAKVDGFGGEGADFTAQLGADLQLGGENGRGLVVGGWVEYAFGGVESSANLGNLSLDVEQKDSAAAFGSLGYADGNTLFYGAVGFVWTEVEATLSDGEDSIRESFDMSGPAVELGVRHRFSPGIQGKLSARYTFLEEEVLARFGDDEFGADLKGETGVFSVKAGVVISTEAMFGGRGLGIFSD